MPRCFFRCLTRLMLVFGLTSANQPLKLLGLWPGRQSLFELGVGRPALNVGRFPNSCANRATPYIGGASCADCAFMRLRRLCLAIFALRLFLSEPIQCFKFASADSTIRCAAMQLSSRCDHFLNIKSRFALNSLSGLHSGNLSPLATW